MQPSTIDIDALVPADQRPGVFCEAIGGADGEAVVRAMMLLMVDVSWRDAAADVGLPESTLRSKIRAAKATMRRREWPIPAKLDALK